MESILRGNDKREIHKKDVPSSRIGKAVIAQESMGRYVLRSTSSLVTDFRFKVCLCTGERRVRGRLECRS